MLCSFRATLVLVCLVVLGCSYKKNLQKEERIVYVAYGSNMNKTQMKELCPESRLIGKSRVSGYKLRFKGRTVNNVWATLEKEQDSSVPVIIWSITKKDEESLDKFEGYPEDYIKEMLEFGEGKGKKRGMAYIMPIEGVFYGVPSPDYFVTIQEGYRGENISEESLVEALKFSENKVSKKNHLVK